MFQYVSVQNSNIIIPRNNLENVFSNISAIIVRDQWGNQIDPFTVSLHSPNGRQICLTLGPCKVLQLFLLKPLKPGVQANEDVIGAAPTGDAPTTSEWSTNLLANKMCLILEMWWYVSIKIPQWCSACKGLTHWLLKDVEIIWIVTLEVKLLNYNLEQFLWILLLRECHRSSLSTLVEVMAWCHQAPSHYLSQCWPRLMSPYDVNRPQWVNTEK